MKARIIASVLAAIVVLSALALVPASAEGEEEISGNFKYVVGDGKAAITKYFGLDSDLVIPGELGGVPVTAVGDLAFAACTSLESVTVPNGVVSIGDDAFYRCALLKEITIPSGVTSIGEHAFDTCVSLAAVSLPDTVTAIGAYAFGGCTSLAEFRVPRGLSDIGVGTFSGCTSLSKITVETGNGTFKSVDGVLYTADGSTLVACPGGASGVTIPSGVTKIAGYAFFGCVLTSVNFSGSEDEWNGIEIGYGNEELASAEIAFDFVPAEQDKPPVERPKTIDYSEKSGDYYYVVEDGAATITRYAGSESEPAIPETLGGVPVTSIGESAFYGCRSLTSVTIPAGVTEIGFGAFWGCTSLVRASISAGVTQIGDDAFVSCTSLAAIDVDEGNEAYKSIDGVLYSKDGATLVVCPAGTAMTSAAIPQGVTTIGKVAFSYCSSLTGVTIPEGVTEIGNGAFYACSSLAAVTIPATVTQIGDNAFRGCSSLASVTIPASVTSIGEYAFSSCHSLKSVNYAGSQSDWENIAVGEHNEQFASAGFVYNYVASNLSEDSVPDADDGSGDYRSLIPFGIGIGVVVIAAAVVLIVRKKREY